jgi:hypothetical protein
VFQVRDAYIYPLYTTFTYIDSLAYGFLPGKEAKEAGIGNLGLRDRSCSPFFPSCTQPNLEDTERMALQWVQKYISRFGGDPEQVTMYALHHSLYKRSS